MSPGVQGLSLPHPVETGEPSGGDDVPASERRSRPSLSETLWGIDWSGLVPRDVVAGVTVHRATYDTALPFIRDHYPAIFQERDGGPFSSVRMHQRKEAYYRLAGDFFTFCDSHRIVGLLLCTPVDWSTYYVRSAAVLPELSGKKLVQRFLPPLFELLARAGVERVEADTSPSNMATLHLLTRLRFNPTGTTLSDRWGALVHFTRFLEPTSERTFLDQYCTGVRYQLRGEEASTSGATRERRES
jgi:ribosomal protein S18 acetylase RimI-like enzyme